MKRISLILAAMALVLGLSQCKKQEQEQPAQASTGETVTISLDVQGGSTDSGNDGSRINVDPSTGMVSFEVNDVVYVGSGGKFVGTLKHNGTRFTGDIKDPQVGAPLHFYFLGNKTPAESLTPGVSNSCTVSLSEQVGSSSNVPVISYAKSKEDYVGAGIYTAFFENKAALVRMKVFPAPHKSSTVLCLTGLNNTVTVNFGAQSEDQRFTYGQENEGLIRLTWGAVASVGTAMNYYVILLPQQAESSAPEGSAYLEGETWEGKRMVLRDGIKPNDYLQSLDTVKLSFTGVKGRFSTSYENNSPQVEFSPGNLQYNAYQMQWRFASKQSDWIGEGNLSVSATHNGWIDLFGYGTSGYNNGYSNYQPYSIDADNTQYWRDNLYGNSTNRKSDWGYSVNIDNTSWRTLSADEWRGVFSKRQTISGARFAKARVGGIGGLILLPDSWEFKYPLEGVNQGGANSFDINHISYSEWEAKFEPEGAVFLPQAGYRRTNNSNNGVNWFPGIGLYWTAESWYTDKASVFRFDTSDVTIENNSSSTYGSKSNGLSVRLVKDVN